jgi:hypothetical protein
MQKLYAYVDETGQDTKGRLFVVSVVITGKNRDKLSETLERIEQDSGKRKRKWTKAGRRERLAYINRLLDYRKLFARCLFSTRFSKPGRYLILEAVATAQAIIHYTGAQPYRASVFVDGLSRTERRPFAKQLRSLGIRVEKVRGLRDEASAFIRLADAIAGLVRAALEGDPRAHTLKDELIKAKILRETP